MVDDSEADLDIARRLYDRSILRNPFLTFLSGTEFLEYMAQVKLGEKTLPAMVLMDLNMPALDGFEIVERVRQEREFSQIPIIVVLSNSDSPRDMEEATEVGADGFQTKDLDIKAYVEFFNSLAAD